VVIQKHQLIGDFYWNGGHLHEFLLQFYRTIQAQAKNAVINISKPDNLITTTLKLTYGPDTKDLRVNSVSELATEIHNIKYKTDKLSVHHKIDNFIDLRK